MKNFREIFDELDALDEIFTQTSNDANLSPGFDINAYRQNQLDLHNYYRSLHGAPLMTKNDTYVLLDVVCMSIS